MKFLNTLLSGRGFVLAIFILNRVKLTDTGSTFVLSRPDNESFPKDHQGQA